MPGWNFADVWEVVAQQVPDALAQVHGDRRITWADFDRRANGIAQALLDAGVEEQDKVAQYLYNGVEYLESVFGTFKAGLAPINTNYRYLDDELVYLWENGDVVAVVFHGSFTERIEGIRDRVPLVKLWLWVDDGAGPCPAWAAPYEAAAEAGTATSVAGPWGRDGDHLLLLYTGGTTGMPKGVMWRQDDLFRTLVGSFIPAVKDGEPDLQVIRDQVQGPGLVGMPACPLMHGTGCFTQLIVLSGGGCTVTLESRNLDIDELFDTVEREGVNTIAIVGDAFAKPMVRALDANPGRWDITSLVIISSSGVMFSEQSKQDLLRHQPGMMIIDAFSSSEAVGMGQSVSTAGGTSVTAKFTVGEHTKVITDDGRSVEPGSGETGRVAVGGYQPIGYYKDEAKSAATFIQFEGKRYSVPGDYATVEADGSLTLLGRGSVCINTGGEKVYPEEVEEVLKTHESVADAVAVGIPDDKFGEAITAVVELLPGAAFDESAIVVHVKGKLAAYKAPKRVLSIDTIGRAPNGKVDYKRLKGWAAEQVGVTLLMVDEPQELRVGYHRDLDAINQKVVRLFALVSEAVAAANEALLGDDAEALAKVRVGEVTIDELMLEVEAAIERLMLLQAPVAGELRYALAIIRIVPELERSGDLAEHIAKRAGTGLVAELTPAARGMLERMGTVSADLWRMAADAFVDRDTTAGDRLETADDVLDDLHTELTATLLAGDVPSAAAADATLVARFYERLGDHAVHIATRVARAVS